MGDNAGNDPVDRALRMFVYGPLGLACYLKDSAPTFTELFVSRGKRELDAVRKAFEERLGFAKAPPPPPPTPSPQQRVAGGMAGLSKVTAQATSVAASMAGPVVKAGAGAAASAAATAARTVAAANAGTASPTAAGTTAAPGGATAPAAGTAAPGAPGPAGHASATPPSSDAAPGTGSGATADGSDLPIAGYDGLSASQIIERLDGMSRGALERVRVYELAHRARRTILASIDALTS